MSLRETFTEWAQQYNPQQLDELSPNVGTWSRGGPTDQASHVYTPAPMWIPPQIAGYIKQDARTKPSSTSAYGGPGGPSHIPPTQPIPAVGNIPSEWNQLANIIDFNNLPQDFDWGAPPLYFEQQADGSWNWNMGPFTLIATWVEYPGVNGPVMGWELTVTGGTVPPPG